MNIQEKYIDFTQVYNDVYWKRAMGEGMNSIIKNVIWTLEELLKEKCLISSK